MLPEIGPWRKDKRWKDKSEVLRRDDNKRKAFAAAEDLMALTARSMRSRGRKLFKISICGDCGFCADGYYIGCGNDGHRTINGEVDWKGYRLVKSRWN